MLRLMPRNIIDLLSPLGQKKKTPLWKAAILLGIPVGVSVAGVGIGGGFGRDLILFPLVGLASKQRTLGDYTDDGPLVDTETGVNGDEKIVRNLKGLIYARVSSDEQADDGSGLERQTRETREIAEEKDIEVDHDDVIIDEGESGREFERPGLQKLLRRARRDEYTHVIVENTDRLGRRAPQTLSMIDLIQRECGVTIVTKKGEMDTTRVDGLALAALETIISDIENRNRASRILQGKMDKFVAGNWTSWYEDAPFGYKLENEDDETGDGEGDDEGQNENDETDDGDEDDGKTWIVVDESETEIAKAIFEFFVYEASIDRPYKELRVYLESEFGISPSNTQLKNILQDPVYIGVPRISGETIGDQGQTREVEDEDLQIIDEQLFEQAVEKVEKVRRKHSAETPDEALDLDALLAQYGVQAVTSIAECVQIRCPNDDCDGEMHKNGQRTLDGDMMGTDEDKDVFNYKCNNCGLQKKFPNHWEWYRLHHRSNS